MEFRVESAQRPMVEGIIRTWPAEFIITRGRKVYPADLPGFCAVGEDGSPVGLATYEVVGDQCELVTIDAFTRYHGIGTRLLESVERAAREAGCERLWLITTNDNLDAMRFYQRRGYTLAAVYVNAIELSRKMKPVIPEIGFFGIAIRDEIVFEKLL